MDRLVSTTLLSPREQQFQKKLWQGTLDFMRPGDVNDMIVVASIMGRMAAAQLAALTKYAEVRSLPEEDRNSILSEFVDGLKNEFRLVWDTLDKALGQDEQSQDTEPETQTA